MDPEEMDYLLARVEARIRRGFRAMVREIKDDNALHELQAKISRGQVDALLEGVEDAAQKLAIDINTGYVQAGQKASRWLDRELADRVTFNVADEDAVAWMTDQADTLVQAFLQEQQQVARRVVANGRARNLSDADIAYEVRESVGLNEAQLDFIESYRDALESGDYADALGRELADGRYDGALERADEAGAELAPERVDAMVDAYRDNWVEYRGDNVALLEGQSAMNAGVDESVAQAVDAGDIALASITATWWTRFDAKVRVSHRPMHGQSRQLGEPFVSGHGNELRYPGDEDAPADETSNCRCVRQLQLAT